MQNIKVLIAAVFIVSALVYNVVASDNNAKFTHLKKSQTSGIFDITIKNNIDKLISTLQLNQLEQPDPDTQMEFTVDEQAGMNKILDSIETRMILVENSPD